MSEYVKLIRERYGDDVDIVMWRSGSDYLRRGIIVADTKSGPEIDLPRHLIVQEVLYIEGRKYGLTSSSELTMLQTLGVKYYDEIIWKKHKKVWSDKISTIYGELSKIFMKGQGV